MATQDVVSTQPQPQLDLRLKALEGLRRIIVDQRFELKEYVPSIMLYNMIMADPLNEFRDAELPTEATDWEGHNLYAIADADSRSRLFVAVEGDRDSRACCCSLQASPYRSFRIGLWTSEEDQQRAALELRRGLSVPCCFSTCYPGDTVISTGGAVIGRVRRLFWQGLFTPTFQVDSADGRPLLRVTGSFIIRPKQPTTLQISHMTDQGWETIGSVSRQQKVMPNEMATDADFFSMDVPATMSVFLKSLLIAAVISADFVLFEGKGAALTSGNVEIPSSKSRLDVEDVPVARCGWCDAHCCGFMWRC